jgi:hypothetical protein
MNFGVCTSRFYHGNSVGAGSPKVKIWKFFPEQIKVGPLWRELMQLGPSHNLFALVQLVFEVRWLDICESGECLWIWAVGRQPQEIVGTPSNNNECVLEIFA